MSAVTKSSQFLWASEGAPDEPPDRLEVSECSRCRALVAVRSSDDHAAWHARLDRARART